MTPTQMPAAPWEAREKYTTGPAVHDRHDRVIGILAHLSAEEKKAVARLWAAAPELLAACEYAADMLAQRFPEVPDGEEVELAVRLGNVGGVRAARLLADAIAKAKGVPTP